MFFRTTRVGHRVLLSLADCRLAELPPGPEPANHARSQKAERRRNEHGDSSADDDGGGVNVSSAPAAIRGYWRRKVLWRSLRAARMKRIVSMWRHMPGSAAVVAGPGRAARSALGKMDDTPAGAASGKMGHGNLLFVLVRGLRTRTGRGRRR